MSRGIDPTNVESLQEALNGGIFEPENTPDQRVALDRLETTLALAEGWVDDVVGQATAERMPNATALRETMRRRRATGGPAEETFAALVGLELRPRRLRDAATLWGALRAAEGAAARDAVWEHPDLVPTAADLDDPLAFAERAPDRGRRRLRVQRVRRGPAGSARGGSGGGAGARGTHRRTTPRPRRLTPRRRRRMPLTTVEATPARPTPSDAARRGGRGAHRVGSLRRPSARAARTVSRPSGSAPRRGEPGLPP